PRCRDALWLYRFSSCHRNANAQPIPDFLVDRDTDAFRNFQGDRQTIAYWTWYFGCIGSAAYFDCDPIPILKVYGLFTFKHFMLEGKVGPIVQTKVKEN